jgi:hypothetical protein
MISEKKKDFRPDILKFLNKKSVSNFLSLIRDINDYKCTLVFGAGVGASVGLPTWNTLITKICYTYFSHWIFDIVHNMGNVNYEIPPTDVSIGFTQIYNLHQTQREVQDLIEKFNISVNIKTGNPEISGNKKTFSSSKKTAFINSLDEFEKKISENIENFIKTINNFDPILIAQMIKNRVRITDWNYLVKKCLYDSYEDSSYKITSSKLYNALVELIKTVGITDIINLNYDDTFYHILKRNHLNFKNIYKEIHNKSNHKKIYYPHGYLPLKGGVKTELILSEEDYQEENLRFDNWSNSIQGNIYNNSPCIFIGLSLTDPNLRRILKSSIRLERFDHYALLPSNASKNNTAQVMVDSLFDTDLDRLGIKIIRYPIENGTINRYKKLPSIINILVNVLNNKIHFFK